MFKKRAWSLKNSELKQEILDILSKVWINANDYSGIQLFIDQSKLNNRDFLFLVYCLVVALALHTDAKSFISNAHSMIQARGNTDEQGTEG